MLFFKKKKEIDPDIIIQETWTASFNKPKKARFKPESSTEYSAFFNNKQFTLKLNKKDIFAWVINNIYRYNDFILNSEIEFGSGNGHSSAGYVLRYINDDNFYFFLISDNNHFRFDVVFNGNPMPLINWTECENISDSVNSIQIIARMDHFSFYVDGEWIGEVHDNTIREGKIGFAGQNYNESDNAEFHLLSYTIQSKPIEVEKEYIRWNNIIPVNPDKRAILAKSYFENSNFSASAVQFKKLAKARKLTGDENFLFAEDLINLKLYTEALMHLDKALEQLPGKKEILQEKGNVLYLLNRMQETKEHMDSVKTEFEDNAAFFNQLGNVEHALGNMENAINAYNKAIELQNDMPIFKINKAKTLEIKGNEEEALNLYLDAAKQLFSQVAYEDLTTILQRIKRLDKENKEAEALKAKILYHDGNKNEAKKILKTLVKENIEDSSVHFLYGLILSEEGERKKSLKHFKTACKMEPEFSTYWLKYAENKFLLGEDPENELKEAYSYDASDPWINNLYGLYLSSKNKFNEAEKYFTEAYKKAPEEIDICINYSDCLKNNSKIINAFSVLEKKLKGNENNPHILNQFGNLCTAQKNFKDAYKYYNRALELNPDNRDYLRNCSSVCIELDMILRAEELLYKLEELEPSAETYSMIANLSKIKGEFKRAELSLLQGLELEPENMNLHLNLASLYYERDNIDKAKEIILDILEKEPENEKAEKVLNRIKEKTEDRIKCSSCNTEWWVPKKIPVQPGFKIHGEPPGDCPAGKCPRCEKTYCITCASQFLKENRFTCRDCGEFLQLGDNALRYLVINYTNIET